MGTITIKGNATFRVPTTDFIISPLSADCKLYIESVCKGVVNKKEAADINGGEYTKVTGSIPYIDFSIDTEDTYYVKW